MKKKLFLLFIFILVGSYTSFAEKLVWPLDIKISQSSSFAEFRGMRFHAGIDLRTNRTTGYPVRAIADGYVSRVKVQFRGYGYGLYITYPRIKKKTVYGHLKNFAGPLAGYVSAKLTRLGKRHGLDDFFGPDKFPVRKGQIVGYSGESGSGPPHLHFEIRTLDDRPIAPAIMGYRPSDKIFPKMYDIYIEPLGTSVVVGDSYGVKKIRLKKVSKSKYVWSEKVKVSGPVGFKIGVLDSNGCGNTFGVETLELKFNKNTSFKRTFHEYSYAKNRQCPWVYDYFASKMPGTGYVCRMYKYPFESLPFSSQYQPWSGILSNTLSNVVHVDIIATDFGGNRIVASGKIQFKPSIGNKSICAQNFKIIGHARTIFSHIAIGKISGKKLVKGIYNGVARCRDGEGQFADIPFVRKNKIIQFAFSKEKRWESGAWYKEKKILPAAQLIDANGGSFITDGRAQVVFKQNSSRFPEFYRLNKLIAKPMAVKKKSGSLIPYSSVWELSPNKIVWDKSISIGILPIGYKNSNLQKLGIYRVKRNGKYSHLGENVKNGWLWHSTRQSGSFAILEDNASPSVKYVSRKVVNHLGKCWAFRVSDLGEGVNYLASLAKVDGRAAEIYADPDKSEVYVVRPTTKKTHKIELSVIDYAGNVKKITTSKK